MKLIEKLELMEGMALRCIYYVHYFHLVSGPSGNFWPIVQNSIGESACLFWSHLFGNRKDNFHYSSFFSLKEFEQTHLEFSFEKVKSRLYNHINMDEAEYKIFWNEVKSCRDQFIAHRDSNAERLKFPRIDLCRQMAEELRDIFHEIVRLLLETAGADEKLDNLKIYYEWHTNRSLEAKCKQEFKLEITNLSKSFD